MAPQGCQTSPPASTGSLQRGAFSKLSAAQLQSLAQAEQNAQRAKQQKQKVAAATPAGQATKRDDPQDRFDYRPMRRVPEGPVRAKPGNMTSGNGKGVGSSSSARNAGTKQFRDHPVSGSVVDRVVFHHDTHSHGDIANFDQHYADQGLAGKSSWGAAEYEPEYRTHMTRPPPLKLGLKPLSQCSGGNGGGAGAGAGAGGGGVLGVLGGNKDETTEPSPKPQRRRIELQPDSDDAISCTFDFRGKKMVPSPSRSAFDSVGAVVFGAFDARLLYPPSPVTPHAASPPHAAQPDNEQTCTKMSHQSSSTASVKSHSSSKSKTSSSSSSSSSTTTSTMHSSRRSRSSVTFSPRPSSE